MNNAINVYVSGAPGLSSYELWLKQGNVGTLEDFVGSQAAAIDARDIVVAQQKYYPTRAAGAAATPTDEIFTSDEEGAMAWYRRTATAPNYVFISFAATKSYVDSKQTALASTALGSGASLVGAYGGGTVQDFLDRLDIDFAQLGAVRHTGQSGAALTAARTANRNALLALSGKYGRLKVRAGIYKIDNSTAIQINNSFMHLDCEPGVYFEFETLTVRGLFFQGGAPRITGLNVRTETVGTVRQSNAPMIFIDGTDGAILEKTKVLRSSGGGAVFRRCWNSTVNDVDIYNTLADGLDFFNCQGVRLNNYRSRDTGDDGLAFLGYSGAPMDAYDVVATNIDIARSRTRGLSVVGTTRVVINGFNIADTTGSGIIVYQDTSNGLMVPKDVTISNGIITNGGAYPAHVDVKANTTAGSPTITVTEVLGPDPITNGLPVYGPGITPGTTIVFQGGETGGAGTYTLSANVSLTRTGSRVYEYSGNRYGIEQAACGDASFSNIQIKSPLSRGFQSANTLAAILRTHNIVVEDSGDHGINVTTPAGGTWMHGGCAVYRSQGMGWVSVTNGIQVFGARVAVDCALRGAEAGTDNRAFFDAVNAGGSFFGEATYMIETYDATAHPSPTGYLARLEGSGKGNYGQLFYSHPTSNYYILQHDNGAVNISIPRPVSNRKGTSITTTGGTVNLSNPRGNDHFYMSNTLTSACDIVLPTFGRIHGMTYRFTNYNAGSAFAYNIKNGATTVVSIPANTQQGVEVEYDGLADTWRTIGRYSL